jgi:cold-inducible RNA-binding protein
MPKLFCGGLSFDTTDNTLRDRFSEFGDVLSAIVILDRESGRSKGFGFVEFAETKDAEKAMDGMRDQELDGRTIRVDMANERPPRREGGRGCFTCGEEGHRAADCRSGGSRDRGDRDGTHR